MRKKRAFKYPAAGVESMVSREPAALEGAAWVINVRAAKDQLSRLLEQAANGNEIIITSDGEPKAKLVPVRTRRRPFRVDWAHLRSLPLLQSGESTIEEFVRKDRDGRA